MVPRLAQALRAQIKVGIEALEHGDFDEVENADLERYLERLTPAAKKHAR